MCVPGHLFYNRSKNHVTMTCNQGRDSGTISAEGILDAVADTALPDPGSFPSCEVL